MTETFSNFGQTNLTSAINNSTTSITVDSASSFPGTGPYRITVDAEIMLVTAGFGTTSWTVTRGQESTSAVSHLQGAAVAQTLTALGLTNVIDDRVTAGASTIINAVDTQGAIASRPSAATSGKLYFPTDSLVVSRDNGSSWDNYGPIYKLNPPTISGWTWMNQGSFGTATQFVDCAQVGDSGGQGGTDEFRFLYTSIPSPSGSWTITYSGMSSMPNNGAGSYAGIGIGNSSDNKVILFVMQFSGSDYSGYGYVYSGQNGTPGGNLSTVVGLKGFPSPQFYKITRDGSNQTFYVSIDGRFWKQVYQVANGSSFVGSTPDRYGFVMNNFNSGSGASAWQTALHFQIV